ncbi:MAG: hypothetical protein NVSMB46_04050 [Candidatus Saccharimonadales bacterium]
MAILQSRIKIGDIAPDFTMNDVLGNKVHLSELKNKPVLLVFLRYSGCPWCNLTIHRLTLEYPMFQKHNCQIVAFVQSKPEEIKKNIYDRHVQIPQFPLIGDHEKTIYNLYGIERSRKAAINSIIKLPQWTQAVTQHHYKQTEVDGDIFLVPATFLIASRTQEIITADYGTSYYGPETFLSVYEKLQFHEA